MQILFITFLFMIGSVFGSFVAVLAHRVPKGESFINSRSQCQHCKKTLTPLDLIPVFSYLILRGKCRYCKTKIPTHLFFAEVATGLLFVLAYFFAFSYSISFVLLLLILSILVAIFLADLEYGVIPDQFLASLGVLSLLYLFISIDVNSFILHIVAGLIAFVFFFFIFFITRGRGMGFGDVKFSFFIGFLLSFKLMIASLYIAFLTGALVSLILIILKLKKLRGDTLPFGPFLVIGVICALLFEKQALQLLQMIFNI